MQEGINPVTDLARENHIEEIKAITEKKREPKERKRKNNEKEI